LIHLKIRLPVAKKIPPSFEAELSYVLRMTSEWPKPGEPGYKAPKEPVKRLRDEESDESSAQTKSSSSGQNSETETDVKKEKKDKAKNKKAKTCPKKKKKDKNAPTAAKVLKKNSLPYPLPSF